MLKVGYRSAAAAMNDCKVCWFVGFFLPKQRSFETAFEFEMQAALNGSKECKTEGNFDLHS